MENKKLVKILLKDMKDLEGLIAEAKSKHSFDALEMEIIHTRAKSILQLLQLLAEMEPVGVVSEMPVIEESEISLQKSETSRKEEQVKTEDSKPKIEDISQPVEVPETEVHNNKRQAENNKEVVLKREENSEEKDVQVEEKIDKKEEEKPVVENVSDDVELEEEELAEANQRLGDSFLKGKSVNDIITDQNKLEFKLSNRPVVSIQSAIGINDRFQYIRELFDGSAEKFTQTVTDLDALNNINEAVRYLQKNFKWKKNETSLKFVNLIKRRFPND